MHSKSSLPFDLTNPSIFGACYPPAKEIFRSECKVLTNKLCMSFLRELNVVFLMQTIYETNAQCDSRCSFFDANHRGEQIYDNEWGGREISKYSLESIPTLHYALMFDNIGLPCKKVVFL